MASKASHERAARPVPPYTTRSSGRSATSGSRLFISMRSAASCGHPLHERSLPRGARTSRGPLTRPRMPAAVRARKPGAKGPRVVYPRPAVVARSSPRDDETVRSRVDGAVRWMDVTSMRAHSSGRRGGVCDPPPPSADSRMKVDVSSRQAFQYRWNRSSEVAFDVSGLGIVVGAEPVGTKVTSDGSPEVVPVPTTCKKVMPSGVVD